MSNEDKAYYKTVITVLDKNGVKVDLSKNKADKLRAMSILDVLSSVDKFKKRVIKDFNLKNKEVEIDKNPLEAYIPFGFVRAGKMVIHPNGLVLDEKWNKVQLHRKSDGSIFYIVNGENPFEVDLFELLIDLFKYNRDLTTLYTKVDSLTGNANTISGDKIDKIVYLKTENMRPYDLYLVDDGFNENGLVMLKDKKVDNG